MKSQHLKCVIGIQIVREQKTNENQKKNVCEISVYVLKTKPKLSHINLWLN